MAEPVVGVDRNRLLLLQGLLERVVRRDALVQILVVGDDAVDHRWLFEGGEDVVEVGTSSYLCVLGGLPIGREGRELLRVGCREDVVVVDVVLERQRGLLRHQTVDPIVLRLGCDFVVVAGEWLASERAQAPFAAVLLVPSLDVGVHGLRKEISFDAFRGLSTVTLD